MPGNTSSTFFIFPDGSVWSVDPCPRYLTSDDTSFFLKKKGPLSSVPLFEEGGAVSASRNSGPTIAEARSRIKSWGSQVDLEAFLFVHRPRTRANCWIILMRSLWHHLIQRLVLCWVMPRKSRRCLRARKLRLSPLNPPALRMKSCRRLWKASRRGLACRGSRPRWRRCGRLNERYLSGHNPPSSSEPSITSWSPCGGWEGMEKAVFLLHP